MPDETSYLKAQERAALSIGDRAAAAKARARIDDIAEAQRDYETRMRPDGSRFRSEANTTSCRISER